MITSENAAWSASLEIAITLAQESAVDGKEVGDEEEAAEAAEEEAAEEEEEEVAAVKLVLVSRGDAMR
jgi:hypothetical protein